MATVPDHLKHFVVLMMSGRSFDHMLGSLKAWDPRIDGLTGDESNPDTTGAAAKVQPLAAYQGQLVPDPGHHFPDVDLQLFLGTEPNRPSSTTPTMRGFIQSYFQKQSDIEHSRQIMYYFPSAKLPVLTTLAREYAVFNRWFSSVPGPTFPNHAFAHYGSSLGRTTYSRLASKTAEKSIHQRLLAAGRSAKIYYYDQASGTMETTLLEEQPQLFGTYAQFLSNCNRGTLPDYSFIEPNHTDHNSGTGVEIASDQHPGHHVVSGEHFIASVYNAIRQNASLWESTALLIVYDQHGGTYDHVPPPACTPDGFVAEPEDTGMSRPFAFDRLGVRVPAILVSPWIPKGTVVSDRIFEHASIPAAVGQFFVGHNNDARSAREASANTFLDLLSLSAPRTDYVVFNMSEDAPDDGTALDASGIAQTLRLQTGSAVPVQPISNLLRDQIRHLQEAEKKLRSDQQTGIDISAIKTEGEASAYIQAVMAKLHQDTPSTIRAQKPTIAGYKADTTAFEDKDLLDIGPEVETLCSVLAAKDVKPPISVGLFGDWGTGKTFFMQKMQQQFNSIQQKAKEAQDTVYCRNIAQLWFNAWHYIDANLWASLVSHIFEELASYVSPQKGDAQSRAQLLRQLDTAKELRDEAERERERAVKQRAQAEDKLKELAKSRAETEANLAGLRLPDLRRLLEDDPTLKAEVQHALKSLGYPAAVESMRDLENAVRNAFSVGGQVRTALLSVWGSGHRGRRIVLLVIALVGFPALTYMLKFWLPPQALFTRVGTIWGEITILVTSLAAFLDKYVRLGSRYAAELDSKVQSVKKLIEEKKEEKSKQQLELEKSLNEIKAKEAGASEQYSDAQERVRQIEEKIKEIDEGRILSKFIMERVQSDDYRKHLGIISSVRRDFDRLDKLLPAGAVQAGFVPIERIILYIDDLDRCPEDKVVEVLQAIHLLLAFKIFVVVVGVDSRWLLRSLRLQSEVFRDVRGKSEDSSQIEHAHWQATPLNYLEKIFQIPFALRPMPKGGFQNLLTNLTEQQGSGNEMKQGETSGAAGGQEMRSGSAGGETGESVPSRDGSGTKAIPATLPSLNVSVFDANPEPLQLKECERSFMWRFQPFIPSPRTAKRFVNVYRLLRASVGSQEIDSFVREDGSGEYQAVQLLLAIQTGYPEQAMQIIGDLMEKKPTNAWGDFVQSYRQKARKRRRYVTPESANPRATPNNLEAESWREFLKRLNRVSGDVFAAKSCDEFVKWGPRVARYSFQAARVLQDHLDV